MKSFFGQGFEIGAGSFILILMLSGLAAYWAVSRRADRVIVLYAGLFGSFLILAVFQAVRLLIGPGFASLGFLNGLTATIAGNWYALAIAAGTIILISVTALLSLSLSSKLKFAYWVMAIIAFAVAFIVNCAPVWQALCLIFLGLTVYLFVGSPRPVGGWLVSFLKRVSWVPLIAVIVFGALAYKGNSIAGPVVSKLYSGYSELSLPWQMTLDVASGELKDHPILGAGPNQFSQAYLSYKPAGVNQTDYWSVEFASGFGIIPTFVVTQGALGAIVWILFFVFFGLLGARMLRGLFKDGREPGSVIAPEQSYARFAIVSSFASASFLWIVSILYVPPHAFFFEAFVLTGTALGAAVAYGRVKPIAIAPAADRTAPRRNLSIVSVIVLVLFVLWGLVYLKNTAALAYFGGGVMELNKTDSKNPSVAAPDPAAANADFDKALALNPMDIYWQGKVEASIAAAQQLVTAASANQNASSSAQEVAVASNLINNALGYANSAVAADPSNYYNYVSAAHVAEAAYSLHMANAYDAGVAAYLAAIKQNPQNPSLYVSLARFQATGNKLDDAIQTVGTALQVKSNYLDAVFLLSQVEAAKGNLADAVTAAQFAVKLNPQNPLLYFQLGLFQYTAGSFADAVTSLGQAVKLQPDYANAKYFLGLAEARLGHYSDAAVQFADLVKANPGNNELALILASLQAGKSPFVGATAPVTAPAPGKLTNLPVPETKKK